MLVKSEEKDNFFSSINLRLRDIISINCALILCLVIYILVYILARAIGYDQITVEKFKDIYFALSWGGVLLLFYKRRIDNIDFIGINQVNLIFNIQYALVIIFIILSVKTFLGLLSNKSILELIVKGQIGASSSSLVLFFLQGSISVILGPVIEEIIFRGFFYPPLRTKFGVLWGIIFCSSIFAIWHSGASIKGAANIFIIAVILAHIYERSKSLVPSIIVHSIFNMNLQIHIFYELLKSKYKIIINEVHLSLVLLISYMILSVVFYFCYLKTKESLTVNIGAKR